MLKDTLAARLGKIAQAGLLRCRRVLESPQGPTVRLADRTLLNFCSNDYLSLAAHPRVVEALRRGAERWGAGSGASHLVCGHTVAHHALEEELASFTGRERALLFSTGYMANLGVISALAGRGDAVYEDRLNHASLLDGGLLSGTRFQRYAHADVSALNEKLAEHRGGQALIVTDGVFSMDGDLAPLGPLAAAARERGAWLMVDDAHGFGVLGKHGGGSAEYFGLGSKDIPVLVGTLGKALGAFGAFVAGDGELIDYLIQKARSYIYTTALPPAVAAATRESLRLLGEESWRRDRLHDLIHRFRAGAESLGIPLLPSVTPIQPILLGDNRRAVAAGEWLLQKGFWISAIRPPTVPEGTARLRLTLSAAHEDAHLDALLAALAECPELRP